MRIHQAEDNLTFFERISKLFGICSIHIKFDTDNLSKIRNMTWRNIEAENLLFFKEFENIFLDFTSKSFSIWKTVNKTFFRRRAIYKFIINNITVLEVITLTSFRFLYTIWSWYIYRKEIFSEEEFMFIYFKISKITAFILKSLKLIFKSRQWIS